MLIGTFKGKSVHCFRIGEEDYFVRRGRRFVAAKAKHEDGCYVLVPVGMSYQQAAMKAAHLRTERERGAAVRPRPSGKKSSAVSAACQRPTKNAY